MRRLWPTLTIAIALSSALVAGRLAAQIDAGVYGYDAWLAAHPDDGINVYLTLENAADVPIMLAEIISPAGPAELRPRDDDRLVIGPGETRLFAPENQAITVTPDGDFNPTDGLTLTLIFQDPDGASLAIDVAATPADAAPEPGPVVVLSGWARPTAIEATAASDAASAVSAIYLLLENRGDDDRLLAVTSPRAGVIEFHETRMDNGIARMRRVDGIDLPAGARTALEPGGRHLMLLGLEAHLLPGQALPLSLTLASGSTLAVAVPVRDEREPMGSDHLPH